MRSHDKFTPRGIFAPRGKFAPRGELMHINGALVTVKNWANSFSVVYCILMTKHVFKYF